MAILNKGHDFSDGDQVTATKLDSAVDSATFAAGSVDNASTQLSGGAIIVKDSGVTAAKISSGAVTAVKLASNAVTTDKIADANVTTDKILNSNITTDKIANAGVTTDKIADSNVTFAKLTDVIDDDTMATATSTNLATAESIKAYVDTITATTSNFTTEDGQSAGYQVFPSGLKMAWGDATAGHNGVITFPSGIGFTVAPTIQISYNKATTSTNYNGTQVGDVTTTQFVYHGSYANLYGPRYFAIGI
jgi:hypothetical protein